MTELFPNLPISFKRNASFLIDMALLRPTLIEGFKIIQNFSNECSSEEERDFINFYLNLKMETIKNESDND